MTGVTIDKTIISKEEINTSTNTNYNLLNDTVSGTLTVQTALSTASTLGNELTISSGELSNSMNCVLSDDGTIVAISNNLHSLSNAGSGLIYVWEYLSESDSWVQMGSPIEGEVDDRLGGNENNNGLSISADGTRIAAVSASGSRVWEYNGTNWIQLGSLLPGINTAVLSGDGLKVLVSGIGAYEVHVYEYNTTILNEWSQIGATFTGFSYLGDNCAINQDGTIIGMSYDNSGYKTDIYEYNSGTGLWVQKGSTIDTGEYHGIRSMNASGNRIILAYSGKTITASQQGQILVYDFSVGWTLHSNIDGEASQQLGGKHTILSNDGTKIFGSSMPYGKSIAIYEQNGSTWDRLGDVLNGTSLESYKVTGMNRNMNIYVMQIDNDTTNISTTRAYTPAYSVTE